jgi:hypothetical protein
MWENEKTAQSLNISSVPFSLPVLMRRLLTVDSIHVDNGSNGDREARQKRRHSRLPAPVDALFLVSIPPASEAP